MISPSTIIRIVASVILAFVIWGFIIWETDPEQSRTFSNVTVEAVEVPPNMRIVGTIPSVTVTIKGPESVVEDVLQSQITARVDLSEASGVGIDEYPVEVDAPSGLREVEVEPDTVEIELDAISSETFPLELVESDARPANVTEISMSAEEVTVRGSQATIERIAQVLVPLDIGNRSESFTEEIAPVPVDASGEALENVTIEPPLVSVEVTFETTAKNVRIVVMCACVEDDRLEVRELPEAAAIPSSVRVLGPSRSLAEIEEIRTQPIDISTLQESDWILDVELDLSNIPPAVTIEETAIDVWVPIEPDRRTFEQVPIQVINLDQGLEATLALETASFEISGPANALQLLEEPVPVVDAAGYRTGTYTLPVRVLLPPELTYHNINPQEVEVTISFSDPTRSTAGFRANRLQRVDLGIQPGG